MERDATGERKMKVATSQVVVTLESLAEQQAFAALADAAVSQHSPTACGGVLMEARTRVSLCIREQGSAVSITLDAHAMDVLRGAMILDASDLDRAALRAVFFFRVNVLGMSSKGGAL